MNKIGIDVGGTFIKGGIINEIGNILCSLKIPTEASVSKEKVIDNIYEIIAMLKLRNKEISACGIDFIGIGVPGIVSRKKGIAEYSGNMNWENVPIVFELKKRGIIEPISICNDSKAATIGETLCGAGRAFNNLIVITIGTGIGAGIVINRTLYEGVDEKGGEIGHEVIVVDGEQCTCSRRGCFEAYASASALIRETKKKMMEDKTSIMWNIVNNDISKVDGNTAFSAAKQNDYSANMVIETYVKYLSEGILNVCNAFRPEAIILSGGISEQGEFLINKINDYVTVRHYGYKHTPSVKILKAKLGNYAGIVGASMMNQMLSKD